MKHDNDHHRPPEEIQAEIEHTRHQLDETLSALESRLTPGQLMDQGLDYLRHSGARQYFTNLGDTARNDPLPLALVGIGLAWLMASGGRRGGRSASEAHADTSPGVKERVAHTAHRVSEKVLAAREGASQIGESARHLGESARHGAERVRERYRHLVDEQPLAIGAVGLALGALLGASAPRTRVEERLRHDGEEPREPLAMERSDLEAGTETAEPTSPLAATPLPAAPGPATPFHH